MMAKMDEDRVHALMLTEAIHSVALSHDERCECDVCLAARGGVEAMRCLVAAIMRLEA